MPNSITLVNVSRALYAALKADERAKNADITVLIPKASDNEYGQVAASIIDIRDWGNIIDDGSGEFDEHANRLAGEAAINGIMNKFAVTYPQYVFSQEFHSDGEFTHITIAAKTVTEDVSQPSDTQLEAALKLAIEAFKADKHASSARFEKPAINKKGVHYVDVWHWGHWRELFKDTGDGAHAVSLLTRQDAGRIISELNRKLEGVKVGIEFEDDFSARIFAYPNSYSGERPDTDFI